MFVRMIVTGASGVLGSAVVKAAIRKGFRVAALDRISSPTLEDGAFRIACSDLSDPRAAERAVLSAAEELGGLDGIAHVVGGFEWSLFSQSALGDWRSLFEINVASTVATLQAAVPVIRDGGAIVCVGAASAQPAGLGMAPYAAAKSAVARIVESLAIELRPRRIRVNAVLPAVIDTPRNRADMPDADPAEWTSPAAVADAIVFLLGNEARAISGAQLPVTNNA